MKDEQDIDKLFRRGLTDPVNETGFMEDDWDNLEQMLNGNKKRRGIVYWLPVISSVAAMLLLVLGWWLFKPQVTTIEQKPKQMAVITQPKQVQKPNAVTKVDATNNNGTGTNKLSTTQAVPSNTAIAGTTVKAIKPIPNVTANKQDVYANNLVNKRSAGVKDKLTIDENIQATITTPAVNNRPEIKNADANPLVAFNKGVTIDANTEHRQYLSAANPSTHQIDNSGFAKMLAVKRNKDIITTSSLKHPIFALSIMGAPEVNGVNSFESGKTGASGSFLVSVNMNKITISTGIGYAKKPYNTSFENYHSTGYTFKTYPTNVVADCRAIDIPLNVDYQVFNKHQNKISVGTGVSSYLMMHENYSYQYADPAARGPRSYTIPSPGRYLFGILNLQATYQRQINSKVGVSVQPYLKLPLTNIGASQVKLQSAGVALGLSWNINSLTKP